MKTQIFHFLKMVLPPFVTDWIKSKRRSQELSFQIHPNFSLIGSYAQYQEDLILDAILKKERGFYVDIGANDPEKFSNTNRFYLKGWSGINIEPQPKKIALFEKTRDRDINLNLGISSEHDRLTFYKLETDTLSTFDQRTALDHSNRFNTKIKEIFQIEVWPLKEVLKRYLPKNQTIDFLSIDTEGFDLKVLFGNDWDWFRPKLVLNEKGKDGQEIVSFLNSMNYELVYKNSCNFLFLDLMTTSKNNE